MTTGRYDHLASSPDARRAEGLRDLLHDRLLDLPTSPLVEERLTAGRDDDGSDVGELPIDMATAPRRRGTAWHLLAALIAALLLIFASALAASLLTDDDGVVDGGSSEMDDAEPPRAPPVAAVVDLASGSGAVDGVGNAVWVASGRTIAAVDPVSDEIIGASPGGPIGDGTSKVTRIDPNST